MRVIGKVLVRDGGRNRQDKTMFKLSGVLIQASSSTSSKKVEFDRPGERSPE